MPPVLLQNPSLVAIVLLVNTRAGPRTVFHYPPCPHEDPSPPRSTRKDVNANGEESDTDSSSELEDTTSDDGQEFAGGPTTGRVFRSRKATSSARGSNKRSHEHEPEDDSDEEGSDGSDKRSRGPAWDSLFGISTGDLESILTPSRRFDKRKFELMIEPLVYVSHPVFVREDGYWRKRREKKKVIGNDTGSGKKDAGEASKASTTEANGVSIAEDLGGSSSASKSQMANNDHSLPRSSKAEASSPAEDDLRAMSMFNVIFVMNPARTEYLLRINDMYEHVAKKLSKALKYEQARSNWVWTESETILLAKEKAREDGSTMGALWHDILSRSGLALALSEVYLSISTNQIAHVLINDRSDVSLQIPQLTETPTLPSLSSPPTPGVWLTTATIPSPDDDDLEDDSTSTQSSLLAKHFALLLLQDADLILKDIDREHGLTGPVTNPLVDFVKLIKPTISLRDLSLAHDLPLPTVDLLARHLIFWRRARAIPPLHQRDIYILSPLAPLATLPSASAAYASRFPALPPLPKILSLLSGQPRPYRTLIPSKDHRPRYLDILAWLLIGGWVTQLRTFAWVRVPGWVKESVLVRDRDRTSPTQLPTDAFPNPPPPPARDIDPQDDEVLLAPHKASGMTAQHLDFIRDVVLHDVPDAADAWPRLLRYFTGRQALEKIAVREGWKAKEVWKLLGVLEARGVLLVTRFW